MRHIALILCLMLLGDVEGEFWVISARYGWNDLRRLAKAAERILFAGVELRRVGELSYFHIVSVGVSEIANAVEIGVLPDGFDEGVQRIREALADAGYSDPCMLRFVPANYSKNPPAPSALTASTAMRTQRIALSSQLHDLQITGGNDISDPLA